LSGPGWTKILLFTPPCPSWPQTVILPMVASQAAGMSCHTRSAVHFEWEGKKKELQVLISVTRCMVGTIQDIRNWVPVTCPSNPSYSEG
jgi:hypothetical protein